MNAVLCDFNSKMMHKSYILVIFTQMQERVLICHNFKNLDDLKMLINFTLIICRIHFLGSLMLSRQRYCNKSIGKNILIKKFLYMKKKSFLSHDIFTVIFCQNDFLK